MPTPYRPRGLVIVTDQGGDCLAIVEPDSHRIVRTLHAPIPLVARSAPDRLVVCTEAEVSGVLAVLEAGPFSATANAPLPAPVPLGTADDDPPQLFNGFSGVFPNQGPYSGGTLVTIIGEHLANATAVHFGSHPAAGFSVLDDSTIVAVTPWGAGAVPVTVTTPGGTARIGSFLYIPWPGLRGILPSTGPIGGGTIVELTGVNLSTAIVVHFGDAVAHPTAVSDQHLLVTAPPATGPGTVPVHVRTVGGVSNRLFYTYAPVPEVTGVTPATGPIAGDSTLLLTGTGLSRVTAVTVGGAPARSFRSYSDSLVVVVTPPGVAGPADITVTTAGGTVTVPDAFGYMVPTQTALTSAPDPALVGGPVTFTAVVTGVPPTTGTPSGTVTFGFGDGSPAVTTALTDGTATVVHAYSAPSDSPWAITATYGGDVFFTPSTGTDTQAVEAAPTTTSLVSAPDPSQTGQPVTFVARVAPVPPGAGAPTGTVTFDFGDGTPTVTLPLTSGAATADHVYTQTAGSPYTVTADYGGDAEFTASTGTDTQTVGQATSSVAVGLAPAPSTAGQPVTVTATVTAVPPGAGTPTGTVAFDLGDGSPVVVAPLTDGTAQATHAYTGTVGSPYAITADYSGDADFSSATGTASATVAQSSSTTTVSSAPDPSVAGEPATFTATVTAAPPGAGLPTGTVTIDFGDGTPGTTAELVGGTAETVYAYADTAGSPYTVTATYNGDTDFTASGDTGTHTVQTADTATAVASVPDPSTVGQETTFVTQITPEAPAAGTPTGEVTYAFSDGSPPVTVPVVGGTATFEHTDPDVANSPYTVTAGYSGDENFNPSEGTDIHVVLPAVTTTVVSASPSVSVTGQPVDFTAALATVPLGAQTPTGTFTFDFGDGTPTVTAPMADGTADVTHAYTSAAHSPYPVTVTYSGDPNFTASNDTGLHSVEPASTSTTVTAIPDPSVTGETVTVTVTPLAPGAGVPTGHVDFDFGDGTPIVTGELAGGTVTVTHAYTHAGGPYTISAVYSGDADFTPSEDTVSHTVAPAATTTTVISSANPSAVGQNVTLIARVTPVPPGAGAPTGTIGFDFGDGTTPATVPVSNGVATATHAYAATAGSPYTVTASYSGDGDFAASSGTTAQRVEVSVSTTSTTVTSAPDPSVVGQAVTFTATVVSVPPASGTPTGTVTFEFGDGTAPVTSSLIGGTATATHSYTASGNPYSVTAGYSGDADFEQVREPVHRHGHLQRRRRLHRVQRHGHPDRQQGGHHHRPGLLAESLGNRSDGGIHRDGRGAGSRSRDADRHGHLRLRRRHGTRHHAGHRRSRGGHAFLQRNLGQPVHRHGHLQRERRFHRLERHGPPGGRQGGHHHRRGLHTGPLGSRSVGDRHRHRRLDRTGGRSSDRHGRLQLR
ncbi:hypothetical protein GCM10012280_07290 [Wenjunlia tyrosinilytica]|uniref:IPT/TIG domain-containing protein n=1 Tax=Wenjunlia tyrosinilytica TaxID=1544741 RepID=A0A917ZFQ8_9ACTN|nr:Ig-like domain repeat protein [Wenjunlia tyrosinilytica]GGO81908.1 hypothetical protein GCM10012280_07290 [Wenjunlia tyrosinilytica]